MDAWHSDRRNTLHTKREEPLLLLPALLLEDGRERPNFARVSRKAEIWVQTFRGVVFKKTFFSTSPSSSSPIPIILSCSPPCYQG
jgi:hypothetical protein